MKVYMIAAEAVPFAKVGGLADVVGALPLALKALGVDVRVVMPKYKNLDLQKFHFTPVEECPSLPVFLGRVPVEARPYRSVLPGTEIPVYLIDNPFFFDRDGIYDDPVTGEGFADNAERFCFFCKAALALLGEVHWIPEVIHCHDSHTALVPAYLRSSLSEHPVFKKIGTVFTIHNLGYQGLYPPEVLYPISLDSTLFFPGGPLEFYGQVNLMKAGLHYADFLTTVSETYALEIQTGEEYGYGLEGVLRTRSRDLVGIINGIDYEIWNPETDEHLPDHYSREDLSGKRNNKRELLNRAGLSTADEGTPLVGMISRITDQKGFDLLLEKLDEIMEMPVQMVILGSGKKSYEELLQQKASRYVQRLSVNLKFDNPLAHLIEAGSDMFLMPSKYEPCGLNQLYSLRYGTIPIVRATGGLKDTVIDADAQPELGTGFVFDDYSGDAMVASITRALTAYQDSPRWTGIIERAMNAEFSWSKSAKQYLDLYIRALEVRNGL